MDDSSVNFGSLKVIKNGNNLAKNEEKSCPEINGLLSHNGKFSALFAKFFAIFVDLLKRCCGTLDYHQLWQKKLAKNEEKLCLTCI